MDNITITRDGKEFTFRVEEEPDTDSGEPWEESEGHGPVSDWLTRPKKAGERILSSDRGSHRFYDFAEAVKIAKRDCWGVGQERQAELEKSLGRPATKAEIATAAVELNFAYLKGWCDDEWRYVGVVVTLLDPDGEDSEMSASLWGVETYTEGYTQEVANDLVSELMEGYGKTWGEVTRVTYGRLE